jgi:hypothetical protein
VHFFKTGATLLAAITLLSALALMQNFLLFSGGSRYTFYVGSSSSNCAIISAGDNPLATKLALTDIRGECTTYESLDVEEFISSLNGKIEFIEELDDSTNYYCSAPLPYSVTLYGKTINLHVCVKQSGVMVASPIIFGGY